MQGLLYYGSVALLIVGILAAAVSMGFRPMGLTKAGRPNNVLSAYGLDLDGNVAELGPVSRAECRKLVDERYAMVERGYHTEEEVTANMVFGFQRSDSNFIEVTVIDTSLIWIRGGSGAISEDFEDQIELNDIKTVKAIVDMYSDPLADFAAYWHRLDKKAVPR